MRSPGTGWQQSASWKPTPGGQPADRDRALCAPVGLSGRSAVLPGTSASITSRSLSLAAPIAYISSSSSSSSSRSTAALIAFLPILAGRRVGDLVEQLAARSSATSARSLSAHRAADRGARLAGDDEAQPRQLRLGVGALDDLDHVAVVRAAVRSGMCRPLILAPTVCAPRSVCTAKAKSTGGRALGQLEQRALGGEGEDAVLIDRQPGVFEQFLGIVAGIDDLDQVAQPADLPVGPVALLVGPVRGEAEFVGAVHLAGADLHFHAHRVLVDQRGVERAVAVGLGRRDIVLEAARDELPGRVQHAQRAVAVGRRSR